LLAALVVTTGALAITPAVALELAVVAAPP
jgi:hypothetical protein